MRSEVRLARAELGDEVSKLKDASILIGVGATGGVLALFFALLALLYALTKLVPHWAAALIIAGALLLLSVAFVAIGLARLNRVRALPKTAQIQKDAQWIQPRGS